MLGVCQAQLFVQEFHISQLYVTTMKYLVEATYDLKKGLFSSHFLVGPIGLLSGKGNRWLW